jgi:hypothetical protein
MEPLIDGSGRGTGGKVTLQVLERILQRGDGRTQYS